MAETGGPVLPSQKAFQVWTEDGVHSGYDNAKAAESTAAEANKEAEALGIKTRYEVRERAEA